MQLGKSLVAALVGGAVGIAALIGIHMATGWDKAWLAILVAFITGLAVRWAVDTRGHASYARGALTALIAILAFLAWYPIQAQLTVRGNVAKPIIGDPAAAETTAADADTDAATEPPATEDASDASEAADTESTPAEAAAAQPAGDSLAIARGAMPRPRSQQFSTWDFVWLCIAGLVAYELGRGTAAASPATGAIGSPDDGPPPSAAG
jgi:hypothetical protein